MGSGTGRDGIETRRESWQKCHQFRGIVDDTWILDDQVDEPPIINIGIESGLLFRQQQIAESPAVALVGIRLNDPAIEASHLTLVGERVMKCGGDTLFARHLLVAMKAQLL